MIKTRIFKFVGHIHNMQLCIEMISFINHENESILRWFSGLFSRILCPVAGCIQTGWGSDLCLPAVVLWNSAPHVSTMLRSNLDLSDSVLDMLHCTALNIILLWYFELEHITITWLKIKAKKQPRICLPAQCVILRSKPITKKPNWAATRPIWEHLEYTSIYTH